MDVISKIVTFEEARHGIVKAIDYLEEQSCMEGNYIAALRLILEFLDSRVIEEENVDIIPGIEIKYEHEVKVTTDSNDKGGDRDDYIHVTLENDNTPDACYAESELDHDNTQYDISHVKPPTLEYAMCRTLINTKLSDACDEQEHDDDVGDYYTCNDGDNSDTLSVAVTLCNVAGDHSHLPSIVDNQGSTIEDIDDAARLDEQEPNCNEIQGTITKNVKLSITDINHLSSREDMNIANKVGNQCLTADYIHASNKPDMQGASADNTCEILKPSIGMNQQNKKMTPVCCNNDNATHTCSICGRICRRHSTFKKHMLTHKRGASYECNICHAKYSTLNILKSHKETHTRAKKFKCTTCGHDFTRLLSLKAHAAKHTKDDTFMSSRRGKSFKTEHEFNVHDDSHKHNEPSNKKSPCQCNICGIYLQRPSSLKRHMLVHSNDRPFQCSVCDQKFTRQNNLMSHEEIHTGIKPFSCETCGKCYTRASNLKVHLVTHNLRESCLCNECGKSFANQSSLNKHLLMHQERPHHCNSCNRYFKSVLALRKHSRMHFADKGHQCTRCNIFFATVADLNAHMYKVHNAYTNDPNPVPRRTSSCEVTNHANQCAICNEYFEDDQTLLEHIQTHPVPNPLVCDICHECFKCVTHVVEHKTLGCCRASQRHELAKQSDVIMNSTSSRRVDCTEKTFFCDCGKAFKQLRTLKVHKKQHTGLPYVCKLCGKGCNAPNALRLHMTLHTGERAFPCEMCDMRFRSKGDKKRHMRTHTGEKPYVCDICNQCFTRCDALNRHIQNHP